MKRRDVFSLTLFLSLILILIMDSYLFLPNQVLVAADLGIYFDTIGIIIGTYIVVHGISIIIFGYLTDKIERKCFKELGKKKFFKLINKIERNKKEFQLKRE